MIELNFPNAVRKRSDLFGRDREITVALQAVKSHSPRPIVVVGERLIGKTSLQQVIARELEDDQEGDFVVLFPPPAYTLQSYAGEILDTIRAHFTIPNGMTEFTARRLQALGATQANYLSAYRKLLTLAPHTTFVLCIDEFDSLVLKCEPPEQTAILDFTFYLAEQSGLPLVLLFTMNSPTEQVETAYPTRFLAKATAIPLHPLNRADTAELVSALLAPHYGVDVAAHRLIFKLSGGHPYFIKLILQSVLETFHENGPPLSLTTAMVREALPRALSSLEAWLAVNNTIQTHLSQRERLALRWLTDQQGRATWDRAGAHTEALQELVRRQYLQHSADGFISFKIGFLYHWLRSHPLEVLTPIPEPAPGPSPVADRPGLRINNRQRRAYLGAEELRLSPLEYRVLRCLALRAGQLVAKETVAREGWPDEEYERGFGDARIDAVIARLRRKLGDDARDPIYLETRPGLGYILHRATYIP
jgi:hypothetical protein